MHSHYYGEALTESLLCRTTPPFLYESSDSSLTLTTPTGTFPYTAHFSEEEPVLRKAFMDEHGISMQLLSFPGALAFDILPYQESAPVIQNFNAELGELCLTHAPRFKGLAGLPLANPTAAARELDRALNELGLIGAVLPANYFRSTADARDLSPVLEMANRYGAHVMIHPGLRFGDSLQVVHYPDFHIHRWSTIGLQEVISQAAITLMYSDLTSCYPAISFQLINLGGMLPFVLERMDHISKLRTPHEPLPSTRTKSLYYDNASLGPNSLALAVNMYGDDRIFFGTDYPIFRSTISQDAITDAKIAKVSRRKISISNAQHLFSDATPVRDRRLDMTFFLP